MTPEELTERYQIRFNEETHIIYAHNNDGDFEVFKHGLEPDSRRDCQNETVARYYHYGSISEMLEVQTRCIMKLITTGMER